MKKVLVLLAAIMVLAASLTMTGQGWQPWQMKPDAASAVIYVANTCGNVTGPSGGSNAPVLPCSDSNDGLSWGTAKLTIAAAITALPASGGVVMSSTAPATAISADPFAGVPSTKHVHLVLGFGSYIVGVPWSPPENSWVDGQGPRATTLTANSADWVLKEISGTSGGQYFRISNLTIDGNKASFAASGGIKVVGYGQPAEIFNVIVQNFGSLGGILWDGNAGVSSTNNVGGGLHDVWAIGDTAGTAGGAGAGNGITINNMSALTADYIVSEFSPSAFIVQNTSLAATVGQVSLSNFHAEGITGASIDVQGSVNGFTAKNLNISGGGAAAIGVKIASSATNWDLRDVSIVTGAGLASPYQIAGTNFGAQAVNVHRFTPSIYQTSSGLEDWQGATTPTEPPGAPLHIKSNLTNCLLVADNLGNATLAVQCASGKTSWTEVAAQTGNPGSAVCYADSTAHALKCSYNNGTFGQVSLALLGSVAGSTTLLAANTCGDAVTQTITGATTSMGVVVTPSADPGTGLQWKGWVSTANTITIDYCNVTTAGITPAAATFNIRVIQ